MYKVKRFSTQIAQLLPRKDYDILKRFCNEVNKLFKKSNIDEDLELEDDLIHGQLESLSDINKMYDEGDEIIFTFGHPDDTESVVVLYDFITKGEWHLDGFKKMRLGKSINFIQLKSIMTDYVKSDLSKNEKWYKKDKDDWWLGYINWDKILLDFIKKYNFR